MIDYDSFSRCHLMDIFFAFHAGAKELIFEALPEIFCFVLFAIFMLHSRESELYGNTLNGKSALAWELLFLRLNGADKILVFS